MFLLLLSCNLSEMLSETPVIDIDCAALEDTVVTVTATGGATSDAVDDALLVTGTAYHSGELTIRQLVVAGIAATNDSFNFETWSATIPYATLLAASEVSEGGVAVIEAEALDSCQVTHTQALFSVAVDPSPGIDVDELALSMAVPGDIGFLPADGVTSAVVTVSGNPESAGATATLSTSLGGFSGSSEVSVVLSGDGLNDASAQVLFTADSAGSALLTVTAGGLLAAQAVTVAGPPTMLPGSLTVDAGESAEMIVLSDGDVSACTASYTDGITVTSAGEDLTQTSEVADTDGDGRVDILVSVDADLAEEDTVNITCQDSFGQLSYGDATGTPAPVEEETKGGSGDTGEVVDTGDTGGN